MSEIREILKDYCSCGAQQGTIDGCYKCLDSCFINKAASKIKEIIAKLKDQNEQIRKAWKTEATKQAEEILKLQDQLEETQQAFQKEGKRQSDQYIELFAEKEKLKAELNELKEKDELRRKRMRESARKRRKANPEKMKADSKKAYYKRKKEKPWLIAFYAAQDRAGDNQCYENIKFLMTKEDFKYLWERDNASNMKRPSIDRINPKDHYRTDNCRFVELHENRTRIEAPKGKEHYNTDLTEEDVIYIRNKKERQVDLAKKYNLSTTQIGRIQRKESWKHI
jgi:hypothetical protein